MDDLENLPTSEEEAVPAGDQEIMDKYFKKPEESSERTSGACGGKWKTIGISALVFLALANPWVSSLFQKIPYLGGNNMTELLAMVMTFLVITSTIVTLM